MHDYNKAAKTYWWMIAVIGYSLLVFALFTVSSMPQTTILQVITATAFVCAAAFFPVSIPNSKLSVASGEIFIFLALLQFGLEAAVIVAAFEAGIASFRTSKRWTSWYGSPAMAVLATAASGYVFFAISSLLEISGTLVGASMMVLLTVVAILYCALTNLIPSLLISLKRNERLDVVALLKDRTWMALAHVGSAAFAGLLYYAGTALGVWVLFAAAPSIVLTLASFHFMFARTEVERIAQSTLLDAAKDESKRAKSYMTEIEQGKARFHGAFTNAAIGMMLVSRAGKIQEANPAVSKMLGYYESELLGSSLSQYMNAEDYSLLIYEIGELPDIGEAKLMRELSCTNKNGQSIGVAFSVANFGDGVNDADLIVQMQDIRERKEAEAKLVQIAFHDALTGLPNRVYFRDQLAKALARFKRDPNARFALMFLDFDRFKSVNDSLGHGAGDELLIGFAQRINGVIRSSDTVARLGGDEFAVLVQEFENEDRVVGLAQRIQDSFLEPFRIEGTNITSSASIGIAFGSDRYTTPDEVIRDADLAMYKAKMLGKAQYAVFDVSLHDRAAAELQLENELRRAIDKGEMRIHYQPQFNLSDRTLCGYEALVRWAHPKRGLLYPPTFLPIAEETGLIVPLGKWVVQQVCEQMRRWQSSPQGESLRMAINVSGRELRHENFASFLIEQLATNDIPASLFSIDLSERALIEGHKSAKTTLAQLSKAGILINIDDFGTGFSSLNNLANLPIAGINIDGTIVQRAADSTDAKEIIRAITSLGRALGKRVHAHGIETESQWRVMQELGCDAGQGNLCSQPVSAEDINQLMLNTRLIRSVR